jgi:uncharacterized protein YjbI with pentapeptide repeats
LRAVLANGYCRLHQNQAGRGAILVGSFRWSRERLEEAIAANGGPEGLDLGMADLSGLDLSNMDLHGLALGGEVSEDGVLGSDLRQINLKGANLRGVYLTRPNMAKADLSDADLQEAYLARPDLQGAYLIGANLQESNLWQPNLQQAELAQADLQGATLTLANLRGSNLSNADLRRAYLTEANLEEAKLWYANLRGANLSHANLQGCNLQDASLQDADLSYANLQGCNLLRASLQNANLVGADLRGLDLLDLAEEGFHGVRLYRAKLDRTNLRKAQLGPQIGEELAQEYHKARDAHGVLRTNFESLGDYEAASWAYVQGRRMEKACSAPWRARRFCYNEQPGDVPEAHLPWYHPRLWRFMVRHTVKWANDWLVELVCEYGESPWRTMATMVIVFALFVAIYSATGAVVRMSVGVEEATRAPTRNLKDLAVFAMGAFVTMDPEGLRPRADWVQLLVGIEALLGISLTGLLGFVLGNKIRRS